MRAPSGRTLLLLTWWLVTALLVLRPTVDQLLGSVPANLGDPVLNAWLLQWGWDSLTGDLTGYLQAPVFWPNPDTLAYTDSLLPLSLAYGPLQAVLGPAAGLNLTLLLVLVADQAATYALAVRLTGSRPAGLLAATVVVAAASTSAHLGSPQLLVLFPFPLALLLLLRVLDRPRVRDGLLLGLLLAVTALCAAYWAAALAVMLPVALLVRLAAARRLPGWAAVRALAAGAVLCVALLAPIVPAYLALQSDPRLARPPFPGGTLQWRDLVMPTQGSYVHRWLNDAVPASPEHQHFVGVLVLVLAAAAGVVLLRHLLRRLLRGSAAAPAELPGLRGGELLAVVTAGAVAVVLAVGREAAGVPLPFALLEDHAPGFGGLRAPVRLAVGALPALAVLAGAGLVLVGRAVRRRAPDAAARLGGTAVALGACAVVLAEMLVAPVWAELPRGDRDLAAYRLLADLPAGAVAELPLVDPRLGVAHPFVEAPRMLNARLDGHPRVNGYSGYTPPDYPVTVDALAAFPRPAALQRLRDLDVRYVLVHRTSREPDASDLPVAYGPAAAAAVLRDLPEGVVVREAGEDLVVDLAGVQGP